MRRYLVPLFAGLLACSARGATGPGLIPEPDADGGDVTAPPDVAPTPDLPSPPDVAPTPDLPSTPDVGPACAAPRVLCGSQCVDRATDANHCGACNNRCASGPCVNGACTTTPACAAPRVLCGSTCTDVNSDPANCGLCGLRCPSGQSCAGGNCLGAPACTAPRMMCGATCSDVASDPANCGGCGIRCPAGQSCTFGACAAATGLSTAGARCNNPDPAGGTDPACGSGLLCIPGGTTPLCTAACTDSPSQATERAACGGAGSTCVTQGDGPMASSICTQACTPSATVGAGTCRAGFVCTGWWYTHAGGTPDTPGCFPFCSTSSDCVGATRGSICNPRIGSCGNAPVDGTRLPDGSPCNPQVTVTVPGETQPRNIQCRGLCFTLSASNPSQGICGSFLNLRSSPSCPDDPVAVLPRAPMGTDNLALCLFRECNRNSECRLPHICRFPEDASGLVLSTAPRQCDYPTVAQRNGTP